MPSGATPYSIQRLRRDGGEEAAHRQLPTEHHMEVWIDGLLTLRLICTPTALAELVLGRLYTEGMVSAPEEVESISLSEDGKTAQVSLTRAAEEKVPYVETVSTSGGGKLLHGGFPAVRPLQPLRPIPWKRNWIFAMADALDAGLPLYTSTRAIHSCFLCVGGRVCCQQEDLGRHNAVDKVVGQALRQGLDLSKAILYTSGRVPTDMVSKVIRAGIPVLAAKAAPTDEAVRLAVRYGLTLICAARRDQMDLYCGGEEG